MWIWILIGFIVVGAIIGSAAAGDDEKGEGCLGGALMGLFNGGYCLFRLFLIFLVVMFVIWLFK